MFPLILEALAISDLTVIDRLNLLEKEGYLTSVRWWAGLRDLCNKMAHEYTQDTEEVASVIKRTLAESEKLIAYWENVLRPKVLLLAEHIEKNEKEGVAL